MSIILSPVIPYFRGDGEVFETLVWTVNVVRGDYRAVDKICEFSKRFDRTVEAAVAIV